MAKSTKARALNANQEKNMKTHHLLLLCTAASSFAPAIFAQDESFGALPDRPYTKDFKARAIIGNELAEIIFALKWIGYFDAID